MACGCSGAKAQSTSSSCGSKAAPSTSSSLAPKSKKDVSACCSGKDGRCKCGSGCGCPKCNTTKL